MNRHILAFFTIVLIFISTNLAGQTIVASSFGHIEKGADVNFTEIANYYKAHPAPLVRKPVFDEREEERPVNPEPEPSMVHTLVHATPTAHLPGFLDGTSIGTSTGTAGTIHFADYPVSPSPTDTFQAVASDGTSIPPDTHGDIDSTYCVTVTNSFVTIQLKSTHAVVSSVAIDAFWTSQLGHGAGAFDPRVHYDPHYHRWIMVVDAYGQTTYNQIMVAVSATGNPTGTWHMYTLSLASSSGTWLDFPNVGYNKRWIAVSGNFFDGSGSYTNDVVYVFDYASMMAGGTMSYGTLTPGSGFTICPAVTYDTTEANLFCMESYDGGTGKLKLWKITGAIGSGLAITAVGYPASSTHWQSSGPGSGADFAPQLGTSYLLQTNDDRVNNLKQRNGKLWCAHTAFLPATGTPTRASAMWWQTDTAAAPLQVGLIDDATAANFYFFPSIAVNMNNDALIGFAHAGSAIHPSCAYSLHMHTDTASTWRPVYTYRHGQMDYYQTFGGSDDRWGDYSATSVDPVNNTDFWTVQESVPTYTGGISSSIWDIWWAHVQVCTPISAPTAGITPPGPCQGSTTLYSVTPPTGAVSYSWTATGTGWSGSSATDSANLTVGSGIGTVSVVANSSCTSSIAYTFTVAPSPLPALPVVTPPSPTPCVGAISTTVNATSTAATSFHWAVSGTGWSGSGSTGVISATVGTGVGRFIVYGTNSCGNGPSDTLNVTPSSGPPRPTIALSGTLPCSGATTATYTATSTGATSFNWTVLGTGWSGSSTTASITVNIGTGAGTLICKATNSCGTSIADTFNATTSPIPALPVVTSPAIPCPGTVGTYTAVATGATSYHWAVTGTGWSGSSATGTIAVTAGTAVGQIIVYGTNSCGNGPSDTLHITPAATPPTPTIALSGPAPCTGGSSTGTYIGTSAGSTSFVWTVTGTGWSGSSTSATINVTAGSGSGTITCKGVNACGTSAAGSLVITPGVFPTLPVVTLPSSIPCSGTVAYVASSTGAASYFWTVSGTGYSGTSTTGTLNLTIGTGAGQIIVQGTNACGNGPADTINVTPDTYPSLAIISLGTLLPCSGGVSSATYTAVSAGATSFFWSVSGAGWSGSSTTNSINVTVGSGTGTIICYGQNACGNGVPDTVNITSSPFPGTPSVYLTSPIPCPATGTVKYFANSIGAFSYVWSVLNTAAGWSGSSTTDSLTVTVGTGTDTIICTGSNECGYGASDTVYLTPVLLAGAANPILATTPFCQGSTATFITTSITAATSYVWIVTGTGWSGSSSTTLLTCTVGTAPATITVYGVAGCGPGASYTLYDVIPVAQPSAAFSIASHIINTGVNDLVTYTGSGSSSATYTWNFGGGMASPGTGAGPNWVHWTTTGLKTITLSVTDSGCTSTVFSDTVLVVIPTGFNDLVQDNLSVNIVPNPNDGAFDIVFTDNVTNTINVRLTDVQGRTVYESKFKGSQNGKLSVNTNALPNGFYTATIATEGATINKKVVIER